ncbi:MAG: GTPase HflX [Myxococcales bacterium]|nr:GTPase HflX [Myxococcales bacterium]MCB9713010.1 GTPase HflX [Myxococcales bacterium]
MTRVHGDTANLKASHVRQLQKLGDRSIPPEQIVSTALARDLLDLAHEIGRRIGLFIDRRGRISRVILGDAHSLELPEFTRVRGVAGRLRGIRLIVTHLVPEPLDREELADLAKLRLDLVAGIHRGPAGIAVDLATLVPPPPEVLDAFHTRVWTRVPLAILTRAVEEPTAAAEEAEADLPVPLLPFLRTLESQLEAATARARAEIQGTRAMVLMVHDGGPHVTARKAELRELCRTAGLGLVELVEQRRRQPDPRTFMGAGKLREVLVRALEQDVELLICDPELSASQARTIADQTDLKVIDRTMLILDIFANHARSSDGKLQVELAQLRYLLPKMVGKGTMMSRLMGGVGGRGPGETKLEIDRRRAKDRIADLERRLKQLRRQRDQQRAQRRRSRVPVAAIVGYTNAGKSTLLNTVTGATVDAENKLFATLDPTVRRIRFPMDREIVLLDTVGFIRDLPPALRQAFSATLEEIADADLLLHVVDVTDPDREQQVATVDAVLAELGAGRVPRFVVLNKCDALVELPSTEQVTSLTGGDPAFFVSALDKRSTRGLMEAIESHLWERGRVERPARMAYAAADSGEQPGHEHEHEAEAQTEHPHHAQGGATPGPGQAAPGAEPDRPLDDGDERDEGDQVAHGG